MAEKQLTIPQTTRGWRMRMALENAGIGVSEMADQLDYSRQSLTKWLHDKPVRINRVLLREFARLCDVPVDWLLYGDDERAPRDSNPQPSDLSIERRYVLAA